MVGDGYNAFEAAGSIADEEGATVTLSYRADALGRARAKKTATGWRTIGIGPV